MSDDPKIISLHREPEPTYWVCICGCMSHHVRQTGEVECVSCGAIPAEPGYYLHLPKGIVRDTDPTEPPPFTTTELAGNFATKRFADRVAAGEFQAVIGIRQDGRIGCHSIVANHETPKQRAWLRRRLREAYRLITRKSM